MICHSNLINYLFCTGLTQAKIDHFVGRLFDKDPPTARPASVPMPLCSENSPHSISITISFDLIHTCG
jgi:hypothetical protein